ncbi:FUSC family protein [Marinactinospora endophytica]
MAWWIARDLLGHSQAFFAPISAIVCLSAGLGARGRQAVDMLTGVVLGVAIGEVTAVALHFTGGVAVAGVAFVGMLAATAVIARPLPVVQAGASAVLVVATQDQQGGIERLVDALVGGGLALLVSQVLFTPGPWTRAIELTRAVLGRLDEGVRRAVEAVEEGDPGRAVIGIRRIRAAQLDLAAVTEARDSGRRMTRLTLRGWGTRRRDYRIEHRIAELDLLCASVLEAVRGVHRWLEEGEREGHDAAVVAVALTDLARGLRATARADLAAERPTGDESAVPGGPEGLGGDGHDPATADVLNRLRSAARDLDRLGGRRPG